MYSAIILDKIDRTIICSIIDCETEENAVDSAKNELKKWMNPTDHIEVTTFKKGKVVEVVCQDGEAIDIIALVNVQKSSFAHTKKKGVI